jgi:hypothetical protein
MTTQKKYEDYKSTGQMLKASDFDALIQDFAVMKEKGQFKAFTERTTKKPISELDDLLFNLPQYAVKYEKVPVEGEEDETKKVMTGELHPRVMEFLKLCLQDGANPNARMKNGENAYLKACEINNTEILEYLINNPYTPADLTHSDGMGNNGLFFATMAESEPVLEYLVKNKNFDINEKNFFSDDQTVFHYACGHGKEKSIDKLIELGANPTLKDAYGNLPLDMMLIAYDEETREEYEDDPKELAKWDLLYAKVAKITEDYKIAHPPKLKTKFN